MLFSNQYYFLVAGLPDITFDANKLPFSVAEFRQMLDETLKSADKELIDKYFLTYDNKNLMAFLADNKAMLAEGGKISAEDFGELLSAIEQETSLKNKSKYPPYFEKFIRMWLDEDAANSNQIWDNVMTQFYMEYGLGVKNKFIAKWFELNLNIGNILSAIYAKKYNMDIKDIIVGDNVVANTLRKNANSRDLGAELELDYLDTLLRIADEPDIYERERRIDKLRWDWLEENTVFDYFNVEYLFAYLCKLEIVERWVTLNAEEGERVFRELIAKLKGDVTMPEE